MTTTGRRTRPRRGRTLHVLTALGLALTLVAAACGGSTGNDNEGSGGSASLPEQESAEKEAVSGGTLVYGMPAETIGWDPTTSQWAPWSMIEARTFFDTLTVFDEDGQIHPNLAESFTPNEDFTEWTIKLRPDVTFHNGEQLTAEVLERNWDFYAESPLTGAIFERVGTWEAISELEMRVTPQEKWVNFPAAFTTQIGVVMAPASLEPDADRANDPIGTGPFVFEEWIPDDSLRVTRNDDYWQEGLPYLDAIEFRPIVDPTSRAQSLQSGELDLAWLEEADKIEQFEDDDEFLVWQDPGTETAEAFVMLNTMQPPLDDPEVRRALAMATDKDLIIDTINNGSREPADGPYRPSSPWYTETDYPEHDPAAAQQLLSEYEAENGEIEMVLSSANSVEGAEQAQLLQRMWQEAGVDVQIQTTETATLIANVVSGNYQAVTWRQFDSPHPLQETVWWHCDGAVPLGQIGLNFARNCNETTTEALNQARMVETREEEIELYGTVQEQLAQDVPYIWISHIEPTIIARAEVIDLLNAEVPDTDGVRAMSMQNSSHPMHQVWLDLEP